MGVDLDHALDSPQGAALRLAGLLQTQAHGLPRIFSHFPPSGPLAIAVTPPPVTPARVPPPPRSLAPCRASYTPHHDFGNLCQARHAPRNPRLRRYELRPAPVYRAGATTSVLRSREVVIVHSEATMVVLAFALSRFWLTNSYARSLSAPRYSSCVPSRPK